MNDNSVRIVNISVSHSNF